MKPAVSVITPCYNQARFLAQAIHSVQAQIFKHWELIIIDDGSTDDTQSVAEKLHEPRIRYFYQENRGLSAARNAGIRSAQAPIIALLDSDDLWEPSFLERMLKCLNSNPDAGAAYCGYAFINANGHRIGSPCCKIADPIRFRQNLLYTGNWLVPSAIVLRKHLVEQEGLFDESLGAVADTDLWIRLSQKHNFIGIEEPLIKYRIHDASMSRDPGFMVSDFQRLTVKLCGPPDKDPSCWEKSKKNLYASFYQHAAWKYGTADNMKMSAHYFLDLYNLSSSRALSMGVWRTFARIHLPPQDQGRTFSREDFEKSKNNLTRLLDAIGLKAADDNLLSGKLGRIRSSAFLAQAEECVHSRFFGSACKFLWRAATCCPSILFSRPYWGTIFRGITTASGSRRLSESEI